jgi:hypothetical protein
MLLDIPVAIYYSDYRDVSGSKIPFHVQKYLNGTLIFDVHLDSVVLNSGLSIPQLAPIEK